MISPKLLDICPLFLLVFFLLLKQRNFWYYSSRQVMAILCCVAQKAASAAQSLSGLFSAPPSWQGFFPLVQPERSKSPTLLCAFFVYEGGGQQAAAVGCKKTESAVDRTPPPVLFSAIAATPRFTASVMAVIGEPSSPANGECWVFLGRSIMYRSVCHEIYIFVEGLNVFISLHCVFADLQGVLTAFHEIDRDFLSMHIKPR